MDVPDLAALVPDMMSRHPHCGWTLMSGLTTRADLILKIHLRACPERLATVRVLLGAEVFVLSFDGAESLDFAYRDVDRAEILRERIDLAVLTLGGPTRLITDTARGITVSATVEVHAAGVSQRFGSTYPLRRLRVFLMGMKTERRIVEYPEVLDR